MTIKEEVKEEKTKKMMEIQVKMKKVPGKAHIVKVRKEEAEVHRGRQGEVKADKHLAEKVQVREEEAQVRVKKV